jgi:hypothetical protein
MSNTIPASATTQDRITATRITPGMVIAVEKRGEQLVTTRRKRNVIHATVTGKDVVPLVGMKERGYLIRTDAGDVEPVRGITSFLLISAPQVPAGAPDGSAVVVGGTVVAMVERFDLVDMTPAADPGQLWSAYEAERTAAAQLDGPAPERDDMRPRVEVFRGRKLRTVKGPTGGKITQTVNGEVVAVIMGSTPESMNGAARQLRRDVIGADERRITDPDAYPAHWYQGAPTPGPATVAWRQHAERADQAMRDQASREAEATCTDPYGHTPGIPGCPVYVRNCNGVPMELDDAFPMVTVRTDESACGADQVGTEIAARVAIRHTVTDVRTGFSDPTIRKGLREVSAWSMMVDGHRVTVVRYEARDTLMSTVRPYAAVLIDGQYVDKIPASKLEHGTARVVWDYLAELAIAAPIDPEKPAASAPAGEVLAATLGALIGGDQVEASAVAEVVPAGPDTSTTRRGAVRVTLTDGAGTVVRDWMRPTWNGGIRDSERTVREIARQEGAPYSGRKPERTGIPGTVTDTYTRVWASSFGILTATVTRPVPAVVPTQGPATVPAETVTARDAYQAERFEHYRAAGEDWGTAGKYADGDTVARFDTPADDQGNAPAVTVTIEERPSGTPKLAPSPDAPIRPASAAEILPALPVRDDVAPGLPYVTDLPGGWSGEVVTLTPTDMGKLLRRKGGSLASWFPGVKFSVRADWGSVDVRWTGGPAADLVDLVATMWEGKTRDSQAECDHYRGAVLYVSGDGEATAYKLPGTYVHTHRSAGPDDEANGRPFLPGTAPATGHAYTWGEVSDPFCRPYVGGTPEEFARHMGSRGVDEWTRRHDDPRPVCLVRRCALAGGHPYPGVHRDEYGHAFLSVLPADGGDGDQGGDGGAPTGGPAGPVSTRVVCPACDYTGAGDGYGAGGAGGVCRECGGAGEVTPEKAARIRRRAERDAAPAGDQVDAPALADDTRPTFRTWEELAAWIGGADLLDPARYAVTRPGPDVPTWSAPARPELPALVLATARTVEATTSFECPAHGTVTVPDLYDSERVATAERAHASCTPPADVRNLYTVTNNARGTIRVHKVGCRDIGRDSAGGGTHWDVRADDMADIVCDLYDDATREDWQDFAGDISIMDCAGPIPDDATAPAAPAVAEEIRPTITVRPWVTAHVDQVDAPAVAEEAPAPVKVGPVAVADLVAGDRVHMYGVNQFGSATHGAGYVSGAPGEVVVKARTKSGRVSKSDKGARQGLLVQLSENPGGWNGWRMTIITTTDAMAEYVTDADAHQFRPEAEAGNAWLCRARCSCGWKGGPGAARFDSERRDWEKHAAPAGETVRTVVTPEEIATAKRLGAEAHELGCPAPYPAEDAEFLRLVGALPAHVAPRVLEDMYCRGYAERAEREAEHLEQSQAGRLVHLEVAEKVAALNPATGWAVDSWHSAIESAGRTLAQQRNQAAHARALAGDTPAEPAEDTRTIEQVRAEIRAALEADAASLVDQAEKAGAQHHATGGQCAPMDSPWYCRIASAVPHDSRETVGQQVTEAFRRGYQGAADAAAPAGAEEDEGGAGTIYTAPMEWYAPQVDSDDDADITIMHDHEDGTVLHGSRKGDGVYEIAKAHGFDWRRNVGIFIPLSRDQFSQLKRIRECADALRLAGHTVAVMVDDVWRPAAVREEARGARVDARVERLTARSLKQNAAGDARREAARQLIDMMPFGEPVKMDHYSAPRHLRAFERIESGQRAAHAAYDYARHLASRADGAASNEDAKQGPRAIMRRIERLEADQREAQRRLDEAAGARAANSARYWWLNLERITEDIAYQRAKLGDLAETGAFVAWGPEHFVKGDQANIGGRWYQVVRVSAKSLSLDGLYTPGYVERAKWDRVHGRRRDGVQLDTPNGKPRDIEQAKRVERWAYLTRHLTCSSYDRTPEQESKRRHFAQARRVVLGLARTATVQEVDAFGEPTGEQAQHARALAMLSAFERLEAGETFDQVAADTQPIGDTVPAWTMPAGEPERVNVRDLVPGDIVCGVYDNFAGQGERLVSSMVGPVTALPKITDRHESGEWYTLEVDGETFEGKTFRRIAAHLIGAR